MRLHAHGHAAVVEHAAEFIFEGEGFLTDALGEDVVGVLEVGKLGAGVGGGGFAGVEDFGAEFGAGGAEEVGLLKEGRKKEGVSTTFALSSQEKEREGDGGQTTHILYIRFRLQAFIRHVQIHRQQAPHGFHERHALLLAKPAPL